MFLVSDGLGAQKICVLSPDSVLEKGRSWAQFLGVPLNPPRPQEYFFNLHLEPSRSFVSDSEGRLLEIDFDRNHLDYERRGHRGKNELIAKSLGLGKGYRHILDLSVGLAVDSVFLTQLGFQVTGIERSPVLFLLLQEAFARTPKKHLRSYQLHYAESLQFLRQHRGQLNFDSIYFDPMYPHKKKSALPKQEMLVFRDLVGHDEDAGEVLKEALTWPVQRVVVKRPIHAEPLLSGVRHSFEGKVVRYDTYVVG